MISFLNLKDTYAFKKMFISSVMLVNSLLGRVVRKRVNVNPGLNVYWNIMFSCLKMVFTSNVWFSLRLLQLKTEEQTV